MEPISQYLLMGLKNIHKQDGVGNKSNRVKTHHKNQREQRVNRMNEKRNINNMSNLEISPIQEEPKMSLRDKLKIWKEDKKNRLEREKALKKPPFILGGTAKIKESIPKANATKNIYKIASSTHKFKPPANLRPITTTRKALAFDACEPPKSEPVKQSKVIRQSARIKKIAEVQKKHTVQNITLKLRKSISPKKNSKNLKPRSKTSRTLKQQSSSKPHVPAPEVSLKSQREAIMTKKIAPASKETVTRQSSRVNNKIKKDKIDGTPQQLTKNNDSLLSPIYPVEVVDSPANTTPIVVDSCQKNETTPENANHPLVYVSPFVTMSRGKNSARKEFKARRSRGGSTVNSPTGIKAGTSYFYQVLKEEIQNIESKCTEWSSYKDINNPPEEACNMINVAIGQSHLLINKKMKQFRGLIDNCAEQNSVPRITCEDLHGFWDLVLMQIDSLNNRFENLTKLRENNWEEVVPVKKTVTRKKVLKKREVKAGTSLVRDAIRAARMKAKVDKLEVPSTERVFDGGFFNVKSPQKSTPGKGTPGKRRSLLQSVLSSETSRKMSITSPGIAMLKVTQIARSVENTPGLTSTPGKSILKTISAESSRRKSTRKSKAVIFHDEINIETDDPDVLNSTFIKENDVNVINVQQTPKEDTKLRRSSRRLTKSKLFNE